MVRRRRRRRALTGAMGGVRAQSGDGTLSIRRNRPIPLILGMRIAARSNTKIGSLYRFFPNKEVLANALIAHYHESVHNAFDELDSRIRSLSISSLADFLLDLMVDLHKGAGPTMKRLLEIPEVLSVKRGEFSRSIHKHIVRTLTLRSPGLTSDKAQDMAVVILGNMKTMAAFSDLADQSVRPGAIEELREMTRIYLKSRLKTKPV